MASFSSFSSPWPNPNSPVLSKIDFGVPLVELFKWLDVRDIFLGDNFKKQDITAALTLARDCKHPDAVWLASVCENVQTKEQARNVLLGHPNDARALCLAWWMADKDDREDDWSLLYVAADMGDAFACSVLCNRTCYDDEEAGFRLALRSVARHERDGYLDLGYCFEHGMGCEQDLSLAKENCLIAAELGLVYGAEYLGKLLDECCPVSWIWLGRAAGCGHAYQFVSRFAHQVEDFFSGRGSAPVVFIIGLLLKGNINLETKEIFGTLVKLSEDSNFLLASQAVSFFESQIKCARLAINAWTLVGMRSGIVKDMRLFVGKMIWEARFEANYKDLDFKI